MLVKRRTVAHDPEAQEAYRACVAAKDWGGVAAVLESHLASGGGIREAAAGVYHCYDAAVDYLPIASVAGWLMMREVKGEVSGYTFYRWPDVPSSSARYAWKRLSDGTISQAPVLDSPEALFEAAGFGAVRVDEPLKGYLAVAVVESRDGVWCETTGGAAVAPLSKGGG